MYTEIYKFTLFKRMVKARKYDKIPLKNTFYTFLGKFKSISDVPEINAIFLLNNKVYVRSKNNKILPNNGSKMPLNLSKDDDDLFDVKINEFDNELMIMAKQVIINNKFTIGYFKSAYKNISNMYNDKNRFLNNHELSFKKFKTFLKLFNFKYRIDIINSSRYYNDIYIKNSKRISVKLHPKDNDLMRIVKLIIINHNISLDEFKKVYKNNVSNMYNDMNRYLNEYNLSFKKFKIFVNSFGFKYRIYIYKEGEKDV